MTTSPQAIAQNDPTVDAPEKCVWCPAVFTTFGDLFGHLCPNRPGQEATAKFVRRHFPEAVEVPTTPVPKMGQVVEVKGDRVTTTNGFGGTTTQSIVRPTDRQTGYLRSLLSEREGVEAVEAIRAELNAHREAGTLSKSVVSKAIDALLKTPKAARQAPATTTPKTDLPEVPEGRYAIEVDGVVKFYRVDRPTEGKWAGWVFVKVQASDDFYPVKGQAAKDVLEAIALDVQAAAALYGHKKELCGFCGRGLTHVRSRAAGYGPDCADHHGLWYPTEAEALAILGEGVEVTDAA